MIKKFNFFFIFFITIQFSAQTNQHILNSSDGSLLKDIVYYCTGETFNLNVNAQATSTGDYSVSKDVSSKFGFNAGTNNITFSNTGSNFNKFSTPIPIGFSFSFYGQTYTHVVVGNNGRLVFTDSPELNNLSDNSVYIDRTFAGDPLFSPVHSILPSSNYNKVYVADGNKTLNLAQIFFAYTDLYKSTTTATEYKYRTGTFDGVDGLLISYEKEIQNGSGGFSGTFFYSYVLLLKDGRIVIYVNNKTEDRYNALLGIQNETATKFKVAGPHSTVGYDYNNGKWKSEGVAWVFTPNQNLTPKVDWFVDGLQKSSGTSFTYNPVNAQEKLSVDIKYFDDANLQVGNTETSSSIFKQIKLPVITKTVDNCNVLIKITDDTYDSSLKYVWYKVGVSTPLYTDSRKEIYLSRVTDAAGDFYVKVLKPDGTFCSVSESNIINFSKEKLPQPLNFNTPTVCDNSTNPAQSKTVNLYQLIYPKYDPASGLEPYNVYFYEGSSNILVTNPENYVLNANSIGSLSFAVKDANDNFSCITGGSPVYFISVTDKITLTTCSSLPTYNLKNTFEKGFPSYYKFTYTYSDGTSAGDGTSVDVTKTVNVTTSFTGATCSANTEIKFISGTQIVAPKVPVQERCAASRNSIINWFDLAFVRNILDPTNQYDVKFYRKSDNSELSVDNNDGSQLSGTDFWTGRTGDYLIYAKLFNKNDSSCFGQSDDIILRVYFKPRVNTNPIVLTNCTGNSLFNLNQNVSDLTDAPSTINPKIEYYSENNVLLISSQITTYDASLLGLKPYIKITYNVACSDIVRFDLQYNPKPASKINQIAVCDETIYSADQFKNFVIDNNSQYIFFEKDGVTPLRASFSLSNLPLLVEFYVKNNTTGCISDLQTVTFVKGSTSALLKLQTDYEICDATPDQFDGKTIFNLDSKKSDYTNVSGAIFKYFKDEARTQEITNPTNYTNDTPFNQTIYLKITVPGFIDYPFLIITCNISNYKPFKEAISKISSI